MRKKYFIPACLFIFLFYTLCSSGQPLPGTLENPIIDSSMSREEALKKVSPPDIPLHILESQALINVLYYSLDGKIHQGQIVIHRKLSEDIRHIFRIALEEKFPFASVIPVSHERFNWDDNKSMAANNTSGFNYRNVFDGKRLSMHAFGLAIDINPLFNPCIKGRRILPPKGRYIKTRPGTLIPETPVLKAFLDLGWTWGGNWNSLKDYQHLQKK